MALSQLCARSSGGPTFSSVLFSGRGGSSAPRAQPLCLLAPQLAEVLASPPLDGDRLVPPRRAGAGVDPADVLEYVGLGPRPLHLDRFAVLTAGGTINKVYFDAKSEYEVGPPQVVEILREAHVTVDYAIESVLSKDSLDMTDEDRQSLRQRVAADPCERIVITHGTDTMIQTTLSLRGIPEKTIVLTGSMQPARFKVTDAVFNIGTAIGAVQSLPPGVYLAMNGQIFDPARVRRTSKRTASRRSTEEIFVQMLTEVTAARSAAGRRRVGRSSTSAAPIRCESSTVFRPAPAGRQSGSNPGRPIAKSGRLRGTGHP